MPGPNDPTLLGKTTAKGQLSDARLNALVADQGQPLTTYSPVTTVVDQTVAGTYTWTCPAGVTQARIQVWGAGAGGNGGDSTHGGDGGGGGAYSEEPAYTVVPGTVYNYQVGDGGDGAITNAGLGAPGQASFFDITSDSGGVFANGGNFKSPAGGPASAGQANPDQAISFSGGAGGGGGAQSTGGCGGGSSASPTGNGAGGSTSGSSTGAAGGAGGTDKGAGGNGGNAGVTGSDGGTPGAGGGGVGASASPAGLTILAYSPVFSATFFGPDALGGNADKPNTSVGNTLYQGGTLDTAGLYTGTMSAEMILPASVAADLTAVTVDTVTLTLLNLTSGLSSGVNVSLWYKGDTALPALWTDSGWTSVASYNVPPGASHTQPVSDGLAGPLKTGTAKALAVGITPPDDLSYYGSFAGAGQDSAPVLTIVGHTGAALIHSGDGADGEVRITYSTQGVPAAGMMPTTATDDSGHDFAAGLTGQVTAFQPGSNPANLETWHTTTSLSNSWTGSLSYKLMPDNTVQVYALLTVPAGVANPSTIITLPAAYQPSATTQPLGAVQNAGTPFLGIACVCEVLTNGVLRVYDSTTGDTLRLFGRFPLDL